MFDYKPEQVAYNSEEINENTKAYIGSLFKGIFKLGLEHIGTSFPEGMVGKIEIKIGGKSKEEIIKESKEKKINISDYARRMMDNPKFTISEKPEHLNLVRLTVKDFGFRKDVSIYEIYEKAQEFGLELCPAETGTSLRMQSYNQDYMLIGMEPIVGPDGLPEVFNLGHFPDSYFGHHNKGDLWLHAYQLYPRGKMYLEDKIVFVLPLAH